MISKFCFPEKQCTDSIRDLFKVIIVFSGPMIREFYLDLIIWPVKGVQTASFCEPSMNISQWLFSLNRPTQMLMQDTEKIVLRLNCSEMVLGGLQQ